MSSQWKPHACSASSALALGIRIRYIATRPMRRKSRPCYSPGFRGTDTLVQMNARSRLMRKHNPLSPAFRSAFPKLVDSKLPNPLATDASGWDRDSWHRVYDCGIPSFDGKESNKRWRRWRRLLKKTTMQPTAANLLIYKVISEFNAPPVY
jgi:hypothetical protein